MICQVNFNMLIKKFREYLVPLLTGIYPWSCISQTANPMVAEEYHMRIGKQYTYFHEIRRGQRMDLLNIRNDQTRALVQKMIINKQTSLNRHGYVEVHPDPRFDNHESVPFPACGATRPILVDDIDYRTTFLS